MQLERSLSDLGDYASGEFPCSDPELATNLRKRSPRGESWNVRHGEESRSEATFCSVAAFGFGRSNFSITNPELARRARRLSAVSQGNKIESDNYGSEGASRRTQRTKGPRLRN
jgi:hypothetical protein